MLLFNEVLLILDQTGLDPYLGFLHSLKYGKPSLALDVMEEFRPVIVDILVLNIINKGILKNDDFQDIDVDGEKGVYLSKDKLKTFFYHFNYRMETERFSDKAGKELSYRDIIKEQVYELIRFIETGENYSPFKLIR